MYAKFSFLQFFSVELMDWFDHFNLPIFPYTYLRSYGSSDSLSDTGRPAVCP